VSGKVLTISKLLGIEGGKLLHSGENLDPIQEFNAGYEGQASEREILQLEYQKLLIDFPGLLEKLELTPNGIFSGKVASINHKTGVFLCYRLPALDVEKNQFTLESGVTKWYYFNDHDSSILDNPSDIADYVRSNIDTSRKITRSELDIVKIRTSVRDFIKNSYEKKLDVPVHSPKPRLLCWMEISEKV
jgi:hypothetical protein